MQNELRCVNLIGRSRRTWKTNQITPAYLKSASLKQHDREPTCEEYYNGFKKESQFSPSMQHASWKGEVITRVDEKKKNFGLRQEADVNEVFVRSTPRPMHVHWTKETRWWSFMSPLNEDPSIYKGGGRVPQSYLLLPRTTDARNTIGNAMLFRTKHMRLLSIAKSVPKT